MVDEGGEDIRRNAVDTIGVVGWDVIERKRGIAAGA